MFSPGFLVSLFLLKIMHTTPRIRINEKGPGIEGKRIRGGEGRGGVKESRTMFRNLDSECDSAIVDRV